MPLKLGVNIDHVATLRQQRTGGRYPNVKEAAVAVQNAGADGIVVHLREDRRHIQDLDVSALAGHQGKPLLIPWSLEMAGTVPMVKQAAFLRAKSICLVPERRQELTTEGGLDVLTHRKKLQTILSLIGTKADVSFFLDPDADQIAAAKELGASTVELHTGAYAEAGGPEREQALKRLRRASEVVLKAGLRLHAGHGLDYRNVRAIAQIPGMEMLNIGFSIISRAIFVGLETAVREMKALIR